MRVADFDFELPADLIADRPAVPRDAARLLVWPSVPGASPEGFRVRDLPDLLRPGDLLVFNDTKVIPARLHGRRRRSGGSDVAVEVLLVRALGERVWSAMARPAKRLKPGDSIAFAGGLQAEVVDRSPEMDGVQLRFPISDDQLFAVLDEAGSLPLPPYIVAQRQADGRDRIDYQTVYARRAGAIAAPTAGLHFTPDLLDRLRAGGIAATTVTLHVGPGTFLPVKAEHVADHRMHAEWGEIGPQAAAEIRRAKEAGGRVVAVGTTSLRLLETAAWQGLPLQPWQGETDIFITPGFSFGIVDGLMTNFHLPRSTLVMLVAAFIGHEAQQALYRQAIAARYRFYSYGDSSLLWRAAP